MRNGDFQQKKSVSPARKITIWPYGEASPYGAKFDTRREKNMELSIELCYSYRRHVLSVLLNRIYTYVMMMIAFITIKSSLVPLIEGLCSQI